MTEIEQTTDFEKNISTHTPSWGVTTLLTHLTMRFNFYSHALVGRDRESAEASRKTAISTHTPSWGVTDYISGMSASKYDFYSHALVGRDGKMQEGNRMENISTHTPSWGVTL